MVYLGVEGGVGERWIGGDVREVLDGVDVMYLYVYFYFIMIIFFSGIEFFQFVFVFIFWIGVDDKLRGVDQDKKLLKFWVWVRFGGEEEVIIVGKGGDGLKYDYVYLYMYDYGL